ncbi:hypothetical protein ACFQ60_07830 [Streptomyces zhihengii]
MGPAQPFVALLELDVEGEHAAVGLVELALEALVVRGQESVPARSRASSSSAASSQPAGCTAARSPAGRGDGRASRHSVRRAPDAAGAGSSARAPVSAGGAVLSATVRMPAAGPSSGPRRAVTPTGRPRSRSWRATSATAAVSRARVSTGRPCRTAMERTARRTAARLSSGRRRLVCSVIAAP